MRVFNVFTTCTSSLKWISRLVGATLLLGAVSARADTPSCLYDLNGVADAPSFQNFHVKADQILHPARPVLSSTEAMMFRNKIRTAAEEGPNFAGHYTIAVWGCGSSCTFAAIVDEHSGQVYVDHRLNDVSAVYVAGNMTDLNSFRFRADSRLLIVLGAPEENETRDGVAFYEWIGSQLKLLRYVPGSSACTKPIE